LATGATKGLTISSLEKGVPAHAGELTSIEIAEAGWNVLAEDLPFPVCVLVRDRLEHNIAAMQRYADAAGVLLCPHGKTTMSPQLFELQLEAGCWGLSLATCHQVQIARRHGVQRILYANELVGSAEVRLICDELQRDPDFDFYCLVDSVAGVELLAAPVAKLSRPLRVLLEVGFTGGRAGVRELDTAVEVAEAVAGTPQLTLVGVEGFEGLLRNRGDGHVAAVGDFLGFLVEVAEELDRRGLFAVSDPLLSAGGSSYFDLVVDRLRAARVSGTPRVVLRSGCYVTHDYGMYDELLGDIRARAGRAAPMLLPALEVWGQVLSRPEPKLAIVSAGRRDFSHDAGLPVPIRHAKRGATLASTVASGWSVAGVSDQHAHIHIPTDAPVEVGDLVGLGPSHPCTTFDKWRVIYLVDPDYRVVDVVRTWF
jgi:D-serine dehydratase